TLCTDVGNQPEQRKVVSSEPLSPGSRNLLEVVRLGGQSEQWVRIRRPGTGTANGIAALIPATLFLPQVSTRGGPVSFNARMQTAGGVLIAETSAATPAATPDDLITVDLSSSRYAFKSTTSASQHDLAANQNDLRALGTVASGL